MQLIAKQTVGAGGASSVTFSSIPQTYTDLKILASVRNTNTNNEFALTFNGNATSYSSKVLYGTGSAAASFNGGSTSMDGNPSIPSNYTASVFSNNEIYIPNYTSSNNKSVSMDGVQENNATLSLAQLAAGLWSNSAAITSITLTAALAEFSEIWLYGISNSTTTQATTVPYASGGDIISTDGSYWYHTFLYSGTFTPLKNLSSDYLAVGGGGGGSGGTSGTTYGSGGAGGISRTGTASLTANTGYAISVGAGGAGSTSQPNSGVSGGSSSISSIITATAGSGGGPLRTGGSNADFTAIAYQVGDSAGGGAGAGATNSNQNGGSGVSSSITGTSVGRGGGGGGSANGGALGTATDGGSSGVNATANRGGGGSGGDSTGKNGGSGIVIFRYAV